MRNAIFHYEKLVSNNIAKHITIADVAQQGYQSVILCQLVAVLASENSNDNVISIGHCPYALSADCHICTLNCD